VALSEVPPLRPRFSSFRSGGAIPVLALFIGLGCEPPDRPPALPGDLPAAAVEFLEPDRISTFQLEDGVVYRAVRSGTQPWSVHLLEVDLTRCEIGFQVVRPGEEEGRLPVSELARRVDPVVLAAVNGDFFTPEDRPLGVEVSGGEVRGRSSRPAFAWRPGAGPWLGPVNWEGDSIRAGSWAVPGEGPDPGAQIVSGFPGLLRDGELVGDLELEERPGFAAQRHPRTAVGVDPGTRRLWLVVVDGRREGVSEGMTLPELTDLFQALGVRDAINLDGGGSSVMIVRGQPVNRPSDPSGERPVVNALVVRRDHSYCVIEGTGLSDSGVEGGRLLRAP
jgi:hypothetical protein